MAPAVTDCNSTIVLNPLTTLASRVHVNDAVLLRVLGLPSTFQLYTTNTLAVRA